MISVIIPAYNSAAFIERTLNSICAQTFSDYEVLIVDDGSLDNTREVVEKWVTTDWRFKYFYKENGGVASARNLGLEKAQGGFITFLDSDDTYEPEFLQEMYKRLSLTRKNICYTGFLFRTEGEITGKAPENFNLPDPLMYIIQDHWISTNSWLIRKAFIDEHHFRFAEHLHYGEDFDFFCRLLYGHLDTCTVVEKYLTNYNLRTNSLSNKGQMWYSLAYMQGSIEAYKSFYAWIGKDKGEKAEYYSTLVAGKMKRFYLRCLWGTLLLGTTTDFKVLYRGYQEDRRAYHFEAVPQGKVYQIWEFIVSYGWSRVLGKWIFRPYKYLQRKVRVYRIK